ncbi:arginine--tRNA ligase [Paenibacillus sp. N4]|uniref:arginine--tRNA ligase n=1 Tax=Paenibacillus vietnamensis TaxID=2590547 RepID=UPI001CD12A2F|nr:arginine--tRNA ligase [Paenibacillus vietnamensis]MCA0758055.1 arginine--tRNA ligase [Paenibacillus vietnamensis]
MQTYKTLIAGQISQLIDSVTAEEIAGWFEYPPNPEMGDLSLPCFKLSRTLRKSPAAIADDFKQRLKLDAVDKIDSAAGYLNFHLDKEVFAGGVIRDILEQRDRYGSKNTGAGKTVVIDYSSPNIAKPFHVAHLRSTVIGHSLYRIFSFQGYSCVGINHLGDWGTQFGKLIVAYQSWGNPDSVNDGGIDELLRLYVKFHDEADRNPSLEDEARAWFAKMEQGDEEALRLWRWFVDISLKEFMRIYELLGVRFDSFAGESFYNDKMSAVVDQLKAKNLLEEDEGAWLVRLDAYDMPPALILKKDGSSLYHTRDITAALYRKETYGFDKAVYVTDYAQNLHFQQWFKVVELLGCEWSSELAHVAFGRVSMEGASLSTRKGNIVKLEAVLQQSIAKTKAIIEARNPEMENVDEVARQVGVGAVIFNDLHANRIKDIDFSWDEALNFEGETGPYLQYTHARASSVLTKAGAEAAASREGLVLTHLNHEAAFSLLKELSMFGEHVEWALNKLEPSVISRYLIGLAQAFNRFYHHCPILVQDEQAREARLALVSVTQTVLRSGMHLIGLESPEKM